MSLSEVQGAALLASLFAINTIIAIVLIAVLNDPPWTDSLLARWIAYAYLTSSAIGFLIAGIQLRRARSR